MKGRRQRWVTRMPLPLARGLARTRLLSDDERIALARRLSEAYLDRGDVPRAESSVRALLEGAARPRMTADLLYDVASTTISRGQESSLLADAVAGQLRLADRHLARGRSAAAGESFARTVRLAFDRNLHFDNTTSPLARDPEGFVAPLRESALARALRAPRGRVTSTASVTSRPVSGATRRVLLATRGNANFLGEIRHILEAHPDVEPRFVDFAADKRFSRGIENIALVADEILTGGRGMAERAEAVLRPYLDQTEILFVDWCSRLAVLVGLVDPRDTRVIVRLHSYEAFTQWPHLLDFSRIDDLVFVSEHLRDFACDAVPGLTEADAPRLHVLPVTKHLTDYARPKADDSRFNLALVGWGSVAKDPLWAIEVLRRLRAHDERFRLHLVGGDFAGETSAAASRYAEQLRQRLAELEPAGVVRRLGQTDDVPATLTDVGVILSSSVRESFHAALVEGAASGAVPVVRDWPFFAGRPTSARTLFPSDWVVDTPDQAARRILDLTADPATWRAAGAAASDHALATWDLEVTRPLYEQLLLG